MSEPIIELNNLKKYFAINNGVLAKNSYVKAVDDVTLTVNKGEIMGLVGESGSGKTTLARVILNLTKPTDSHVTFNGVNL